MPFLIVVCVQNKKKRKFSLQHFAFFLAHIMRPQVKERDLSPQFSVESFIGILFIELPIGIGKFSLENFLSKGLFWDPFCCFCRRCVLLYAYTTNNCVQHVHNYSRYYLHIKGACFLVCMTYLALLLSCWIFTVFFLEARVLLLFPVSWTWRCVRVFRSHY